MKGVIGQEDSKLVKTEAVSQLDASDSLTLVVLYLSVSWLFVWLVTVINLETMAVIMTVVSVYSVYLLFCGVSFSSPALWSHLCECFKFFIMSFRMAQWGTLMIWLRSILSITAPPSATCVKGWRSYGNAK